MNTMVPTGGTEAAGAGAGLPGGPWRGADAKMATPTGVAGSRLASTTPCGYFHIGRTSAALYLC